MSKLNNAIKIFSIAFCVNFSSSFASNVNILKSVKAKLDANKEFKVFEEQNQKSKSFREQRVRERSPYIKNSKTSHTVLPSIMSLEAGN